MIIKRSSFVYQLVDSVYSRPSQNLCNFFWQVVFSIVAWIAIAIVCFILATVFCFALVQSFVIVLSFFSEHINLVYMFDYFQDNDYLFGVMIVAFFVNFVTVVVYSCALIKWIFTSLAKEYSKNPKIKKSEEKDSLVIEFIMAKKRKICPIIEFKE